MNVTLDRAAFADALNTVLPAASKPGTHLYVLTGVHIDVDVRRVAVTCSNLDETITVCLPAPIGADCGRIVAPAQLLAKIVRAAKAAEVTLDYDSDGGDLVVTIGRARSRIHCLPVDEWPTRLGQVEAAPVTFDAAALANLAEVCRYASTDPTRPVLTGVHFDGDRIEAADSYRFMRAPATLPDGVDMLVPAAVVARIAEADSVEVACDSRMASFTVDAVTYTTRLIEGTFPNFDSFLRSGDPHTLTVDAAVFTDAIRAAMPVTSEATPVRLTVDGGELTVRSIDPDVGEAAMTIDCDGTLPGEVGFNPRRLLHAVATFDGPVTLSLVDTLKPVFIDDNRGVRCLMPVRISK